MRTLILIALAVTACSIAATSIATAEEIDGKVATVAGKSITIASSSNFLPAVGDKFGVFVEIPGVGKASVATGIVTRVTDGVIVATIEKSTGTVKLGQIVSIEAPSPTKRTKPTSSRANWGTAINPDGDCTIRDVGGKLTIDIPQGNHDLWYGGDANCNAPRSLHEISGDFTAVVKVTAKFDAAVASPRFWFQGAGLMVWDSKQHYLRLERNFLNNAHGELCWSTPLYDRNGRRRNGCKVADATFFEGESTWLRIERSGKTLVTSISHDGEQWITTAVLKTEFPDTVQIGVHGICVADKPFAVEFQDFTLRRETPTSVASASSIPIDGVGNVGRLRIRRTGPCCQGDVYARCECSIRLR